MKNDNNAVTVGTIQHVAYHPLKYPDIYPDIWCPHWNNNGWMQQGGPDPAMNNQIIGVCKVALTQSY